MVLVALFYGLDSLMPLLFIEGALSIVTSLIPSAAFFRYVAAAYGRETLFER